MKYLDPAFVTQLAQEHTINTSKPQFPINTMSLFYVAIARLVVNEQPVGEQVHSAIKEVSNLLNGRDRVLGTKPNATPAEQLQELKPEVDRLLQIVHTPTMVHSIESLFLHALPLQEAALAVSADAFEKAESRPETFTSLLRLRSVDSLLYATVITEVLKQHKNELGNDAAFTALLIWNIGIALQINDLSDTIFYAKDDLESGSAPIITLLQKVKHDKPSHKELIESIFANYLSMLSTHPNDHGVSAFISSYCMELRDKVLVG